MSTLREFHAKHLKTDLSSGLVVFLIALPLCLGISLASGAPLFSGIIAGVVGGVVVGLLSNSAINVSGPAASVALVVFTAIQDLGSFRVVLVAVMLAGVIQIVLGYLRAGTVAYFFPNTMIKGILASIGLMLIIKQVPHAFGVRKLFKDGVSFGDGQPIDMARGLVHVFDNVAWGTVMITGLALAVILVWERPALKERAFFRTFPSALAAVLLGIGCNEVFVRWFPALALVDGQHVELPVASGPGDFLGFFTFPDFAGAMRPEIVSVALSIAFIASLESLLSTEAGDKLDPYKRRTSTNQELKAQGIGNIVAGLIGGIPVTAVIVRTSANVTSGGRTKVATITHGALMLVCVALIPTLLNKIPLAALSAVLFVVGYKLTSVAVFRAVYAQGRRQFLPFIITIVAVMATDLISGILIGGTVAVFFILRDNYKNGYEHKTPEDTGRASTVMVLSQETTFLNKADIMLFLSEVPEGHHLVIDGRQARFVHPDIHEIITDFQATAAFKNIHLELLGLERLAPVKHGGSHGLDAANLGEAAEPG
jgi:MFS superfamily sulfate permease-like transporter